MSKPLCHRSHNKAFTHPTLLDSPANRAAIKMCEACPLRRACAEKALTAGTSLDGGHVGPAAGVIQAGVVCYGDQATALALAGIAGRPVPDYEGERTRKTPVADRCVNCDVRMVAWTRDRVPEGYVMHYAKSHCVNCRGAYSRAYPPSRRGRSGLRKTVDRRRHTAPPRRDREVVIQLPLFDLRESA